MVLANAVEVEMPFDFDRLGNGMDDLRLLLFGFNEQFLIEDVFAKDDAVVADVDARAGN
jgi:hypothetical protein